MKQVFLRDHSCWPMLLKLASVLPPAFQASGLLLEDVRHLWLLLGCVERVTRRHLHLNQDEH